MHLTLDQTLSIIAVLLSPIFALQISKWLQDRKERYNRKFEIFLTLMSRRHQVINDETAKAFNSIDVLFHDSSTVRKKWHEYLELVNQHQRSNEYGKKLLELCKTMADELGYKNSIDHLDLDRVYIPKGVAEYAERQAEVAKEFLRVLKASGSIQFTEAQLQVPLSSENQ